MLGVLHRTCEGDTCLFLPKVIVTLERLLRMFHFYIWLQIVFVCLVSWFVCHVLQTNAQLTLRTFIFLFVW